MEEGGRALSRSSSGQLANQPSDHSTNQPSDHPTILPTNHPSDQPSNYPTNHSTNYPSDYPTNYPTTYTQPEPVSEDPVRALTSRQAEILTYLLACKDRVANKSEIVQRTGISEGTVKYTINVLIKRGFITSTKKYHKGAAQGFSFKLNKALVQRFSERQEFNPKNESKNSGLSDHPTDYPSNQLSNVLYSSSSVFNKTTTPRVRERDIAEDLATDPEMGYWRQKELTAKQVVNWMELSGSSYSIMKTYLNYCAYEMSVLGVEETKPVENVQDWFFRILERTGAYRKPKGYQTLAERRISEMRALTEKHRAEAEKLKKVEQELAEAREESAYLRMMADPEGDLYQACFERLNDFDRRRAKTKGEGEAFRAAMRREFRKVNERKEAT